MRRLSLKQREERATFKTQPYNQESISVVRSIIGEKGIMDQTRISLSRVRFLERK